MKKTLIYFNLLLLVCILFFIALIIQQNKNKKTTPLFAAPMTTEPILQPQQNSKSRTKKPIQKKESVLLSAPLVKQLPELRNGCEITSLTMLLQYYGVKKEKMELVPELIQDKTPIKRDMNGKILTWGDPDKGFVGDITGKTIGYGVYHKPLFRLLKNYIDTAIDLSGSSLNELELKLSKGFPVVVWTTINYTAPAKKDWRTWKSPTGTVRATFKEHSVLLVGYDKDHIYLNDPLSGKKQVKIEKKTFLSGWTAMGKQAISYGD